MKDPLDTSITPYDLLNVPINANKETIELAFKRALASRRCNVQEAIQARNTLNRPVERAFVDLFFYEKVFLDQLNPTFKDPSYLLEKRFEVAQRWRDIQKNSFPHIASTHSLALLWYYWALYCEEVEWAGFNKSYYKRIENLSKGPPLDVCWANTISNWVFLINSEDFWDEWIELKREIYSDNSFIKDLCIKLENHFSNLFHKLAERYINAGDKVAALRYKDYEILFSTEMNCARKLKEVGFKIIKNRRKVTISCGRRMLEQVGILDFIQRQFEEASQKDPENPKLREVVEALSPYAILSELIKRGKYDEVIRVISGFPAREQAKKEVLFYLAKAYLEKGKQYFGLNQFEDAFKWWRLALQTEENLDDIAKVVVSLCKTKASSIQLTEPDTAIALLELAIEMLASYKVPSVELKKSLSLLYLNRGIKRINEAQEKLRKGLQKGEAKSDIKKGVEEIRIAVKLDPQNDWAREQLSAAENILNSIDHIEYLDVIEFMNTEQWDKASERLNEILSKNPRDTKARELLDICYANLCFFCKGKKNKADKSASIKVDMYKIISISNDGLIKYQTTSVHVPRCRRCKKVHEKNLLSATIGMAVGMLLGGWLITKMPILHDNEFYDLGLKFLIGIVPLSIFFASIGYGLGRLLFGKEVNPENKQLNAPIVKRLLAEGWKIGEKPPDVQR